MLNSASGGICIAGHDDFSVLPRPAKDDTVEEDMIRRQNKGRREKSVVQTSRRKHKMMVIIMQNASGRDDRDRVRADDRVMLMLAGRSTTDDAQTIASS
jgi:hypothetical protein